ncbi:MAG: PGF-pre-PGF domain-containing protein, partial [Halobacteriota archaeon]
VSQDKGFEYEIEETDWGPFLDCVNGKCSEDGGTAGWMVWVNGDSIDISADEREIAEGDSVVWYYSKGMSDSPDTSDYVVRITVENGFYIEPQVQWPSEAGGETTGSTSSSDSSSKGSDLGANKSTYYLTNYSRSFNIQLQPNGSKVEFSSGIAQKFNVTSLNLTSESKNLNLRLSHNVFTMPADVYDSFSIELNQSASGSIQFRVSKQWLNDKNHTKEEVVLIKHRNGENIELSTAIKNESEEYVYYQSQLSSFSNFAIIVKWDNFPLNVTDERIVKALNWLKTVQNDDGGFANPNENSSISKTSWAVMALVTAKQDPHNWTKNNNSSIDYLRNNLNQSLGEMGTADYARTILALNAAGEDPEEFGGVNLTSQLKSEMKQNGQIGDFVYTTIWGTLALEACGEDVNQSINWLKEQQNEDGGFPWAVGEKSDYDDTSAAIQALIAGGEHKSSETIKRALEYLKTGQNEDGGVRYFGSSASNAASDAWAIQALIAAGVNPADWKENNSSVVDHLLGLQTEEGLFKYTSYQTSNPGYMTVSAIMGLLGKPQPIGAINFNQSDDIEFDETNLSELEKAGGKAGGTEVETDIPEKTSTSTTTTVDTPEATAKNLSEEEGTKEEKGPTTPVSTVGILVICMVLVASVSIAYLWKRTR